MLIVQAGSNKKWFGVDTQNSFSHDDDNSDERKIGVQ